MKGLLLLCLNSLLLHCIMAVEASQKVCVFDIDGTLLGHATSSTRSKAAVKACKSAGFHLAVNTAEGSSGCQRNKHKLEALGISVPDKMYRCHVHGVSSTESKLENMKATSSYYGASAACTLLFDDRTDNIHYVSKHGFATQKAHAGITSADLTSALHTLSHCSSHDAVTPLADTWASEAEPIAATVQGLPASLQCLHDKCGAAFSKCQADTVCKGVIDCVTPCGKGDSKCALSCVKPHILNSKVAAVGSCGGIKGCWSKAVAAAASSDTATVHKIEGATCGEVVIPKAAVSKAGAFGVKPGTCSSVGYTVAAGTKSITVPVLGKVTVHAFTKPSVQLTPVV